MTHRCAYSGEVPGAKAHRDYIMADVTIRERCTEGIARPKRGCLDDCSLSSANILIEAFVELQL